MAVEAVVCTLDRGKDRILIKLSRLDSVGVGDSLIGVAVNDQDRSGVTLDLVFYMYGLGNTYIVCIDFDICPSVKDVRYVLRIEIE